ncbi:MAG TPA: hypothetical protein DCL66_15045 [Gammaproteobacteria bacterium]|nr:hypothetical protein [Gammaproteobacteria bacterium]
MKVAVDKSSVIGALLGIGIVLSANLAFADAISIFSIGNQNSVSIPELIQLAAADERSRSRRPRGEPYHRGSREQRERGNPAFSRRVNEYVSAYLGDGRSDFRVNEYRNDNRREYRSFSYTSPPLRGGSSRRTRIIKNPYADRFVTGITLAGVDNHQVHIKDVVAYPGRYLISPLGYSLSQYDRPRFISTANYINYISVAAKRKEYFTVTFHYD